MYMHEGVCAFKRTAVKVISLSFLVRTAPLFNMVSFLARLGHRKANIKYFLLASTNYNQPLFFQQLRKYTPKYTGRTWKKLAKFFQVSIRLNPGRPQPKIINTSFCALVAIVLTKLRFWPFKIALQTRWHYPLTWTDHAVLFLIANST